MSAVVLPSGRVVGPLALGRCADSALATAASELGAERPQRLIELTMGDGGIGFDAGMSCDSRLRVWLERTSLDDAAPAVRLARRIRHLRRRSLAVAAVRDSDGALSAFAVARETAPGSMRGHVVPCPGTDGRGSTIRAALLDAVAAALRSGLPRVCVRVADGVALAWPPQWRLVLLGATRLARIVARWAAAADWNVLVLDRDVAALREPRWPRGVRRRACVSLDDLAGFPVDARTCVVASTHDYKEELVGLAAALSRGAAYAGALAGARRASAVRRELAAHIGDDARSMRAPLGLDVGAVSAEEIAASLIAELVAVRRHATGRASDEVLRRGGASQQGALAGLAG